MRSTRTLRRALTAAMLAVAFLFQGTWALAGVTGGISGVVHDDTGAPVAGATVTATAPSQTATVTTDAQGHFEFLTLAPDTYTVRVVKDGYQTVAQSGLTVLADQTQAITIVAPRALKVIATAHTSAAALVKPGVGGDLYNVTPAQQQVSMSLGGGGNLNNAYSAISAVPGLYVPTGGMGWNQSVVIHGENPYTTGFEYDGVPVNRAFDQYNTSTESSLGLQELQVYTGGGPVSVSSSGISGFINQVIKTGTYPGYATLEGGIGTEAFYHSGTLEAGGATPDRNFSYYVGISGYDQAYRICDQQNCADLFQPGQVFNADEYTGFLQAWDYDLFGGPEGSDYGFGDSAPCAPGGSLGFFAGMTPPPEQPSSYYLGCLSYGSGIGNNVSYITDREDVVNLHFGIPRADGQRDDIQALWSDSAEQTFAYDSPIDAGPGVAQAALDASGLPYATSGSAYAACTPYCQNYSFYQDGVVYNLPFGTPVNNTTGVAGLPYQLYYQPDSPENRAFQSALPVGAEGLFHNDVGIGKLQWTHPFSDNAYVRVYVYSMFSDWTEDDPNAAYEYLLGPYVPLSPNYDLITHTAGGEVAFADQVNDQNLLQLTVNYITATTSRWNNTGFINGALNSPAWDDLIGAAPNGDPCFAAPTLLAEQEMCAGTIYGGASPIGLVGYSAGRYTCYGIGTMTATSCVKVCPTATYPCTGTVGYTNGPYTDDAYDNYTFGEPAITGAALAAGAQYETLWQGNASASWNLVTPKFYNMNLSEEWRPTDKLVVDLSGRYDNYDYMLANTQNAANDFYAQEIQDYACVNPSTSIPLLTPLKPGVEPPPSPAYYATCPTGFVHPDGLGSDPLFTDVSPPSYDMFFWSARAALTYNSDPNTVWRFSAGRYAEPPLTASVQYFNASGNNTSQWANFMLFGFLSPFHPIPGETSAQYDLSFEHHFANTPFSIKLTPFYEDSANWEQQFFIGAGYVTQIPVGQFRSYGAELAIQAGDFAAQGLSGMLSFTYTNAAVKYQSLVGESAVLQLNSAIEGYNCLIGSYYTAHTAACDKNAPELAANGGACQYYTDTSGSPGTPSSCSSAADPDAVLNPFYNATPQPYMDPNGWYPDPAAVGSGLYFGPGYNDATGFASPYDATLILNWRIGKLAITPSLQLESGTKYGSPMDIVGVDPISCATTGLNQGFTGVATTNNPHDCDYTTYYGGSVADPWGYLYVPNPQTGQFAQYGAYTEPNILVANVQLTYQLSPKVTLMVTAASLWHTCFGGSSEPWTVAAPPSNYVCSYGANSFDYIGGLNGAGAYVGSSPFDTAANGITPPAWEDESYLPGGFNGAGSYLPFNLFVQAQIHL